MRRLNFFLFSSCLVVASCAAHKELRKGAPAKWDFDSGSQPYAITVSTEQERGPDQKTYRFELRAGDVWKHRGTKTYRAEVDTRDFVKQNSDQWYGLGMFIPKDFPIEDNRLVVGQWFETPVRSNAERGPALAQRFRNGIFSITVEYLNEDKLFPDAVRKEIYSGRDLRLGEWNDFIYHIKWHADAKGFIEVWLNGKVIAHYRGPIGFSDANGPRFKFGLYRDKSEKTYIAYFSGYKRGRSFTEVDPSFSPAK